MEAWKLGSLGIWAGAYPFDGVVLLAPSAFTAGHFFWQTPGVPAQPKVTKKVCAPPSVPPVAGSLRPGAFRARAAYDVLRKSTSRAFGYAEGLLSHLALQAPLLSLLKSRIGVA